jgi:hypothetical protein
MKVDNGILEKNNALQLQQIAGLKRHQYEYESRLSDMRQSMRTLNMERLQSEKQIETMSEMLEETKKYKALYAKAQARSTKWKTRALELSKKYISLEKDRIDAEHEDALNASLMQLSSTDSTEFFQAPPPERLLKGPKNERHVTSSPRNSQNNAPPHEDIMAIWNRNYSSGSTPGGAPISAASSYQQKTQVKCGAMV